jgi:hypothetical protein
MGPERECSMHLKLTSFELDFIAGVLNANFPRLRSRN